MNERYPFIKISINFMKVLAYLSAGLGIIGALIILFGKTPGSGKLAGLGVLLMGGFYFLVLYLFSEVIRLLCDLDEQQKKIMEIIQAPKREIR
ncbi:hypothetical protein KAR10_07220 [bacterium]|nr:hypothetical protein [bacterium]